MSNHAPHRRLGSDDSGIAMLTVVGVMVVVTILAVGSFVLARQTLHESVRVEGEGKAFRAASSGLETVLSQYSEGGTYPVTGTTPDGTWVVTEENIGGGEYLLRSVGTDSRGASETVNQQFYFMNLWKMNFAGTGPQSLISGTSGLNGNSNILGPFYMKGNFSVDSNMSVREGPLFVKGGTLSVASSGLLGMPSGQGSGPIKIYCDGTVPANTGGTTTNRGVYISSVSRSVPDITLPTLSQTQLEAHAAKAIVESVDNMRGTTGTSAAIPAVANLEATSGNPATYTTISPPNTGTFARARTQAGPTNQNYKFIGRADGTISAKGTGTNGLTIGGRTFGAWGSVTATGGVSLTGPGPTGVLSYPANSSDDFAYDNARKILFIYGTVFVDGPLTISEDMTYIGNGTIVANGTITLNGTIRPYGANNTIGQDNKWALGLVTPLDIIFNSSGSNPGGSTEDEIRANTPTYAGAFFAERIAHIPGTNTLVRGTIIAGKMRIDHPNTYLVTNPLLPEYLPDSLPARDGGLLMPGLWTRH